jgi:hypothetical protein
MSTWEQIRHQAAIAGRVTDQQDGGPVAGAAVSIASSSGSFADWLALKALAFGPAWDALAVRPDRVPSAVDGQFCFIDLPDGTYTVTAAWAPQGSRYGTAVGTATVARDAAGTIKLATVDLALPPTRISGVVTVKSSQSPVVMAEVRLAGSSDSTFTDGQGRYVLSAIEPGPRTVRVLADGFAPAEASIDVDGRGKSVTMNFALGG